MTTTARATDRYQAAFQERLARPDRFAALRKKAFRRFEAVGFPTARKGNERWKYTNVAAIARTEYDLARAPVAGNFTAGQLSRIPSGEGWHTIAFVDGVYSKELSSASDRLPAVSVERLSTSQAPELDLLGSLAEMSGDDGFGALNTALFGDGALIRITGEMDDQHLIHVLHITTDRPRPALTNPRVLVVAEKFSKASLVESYVGLERGTQFSNAVAEILVGEGAALRHYRILEAGHESFHIGTTRVRVDGAGSYRSITFAFGGRIGRNDMHVLLDGPGSECTLNGLYMTSERDHLDNHISLTHAKPHATSRQLYKGILTGNSRAVFSGQVRVEKDAQKTYAEQRDMNLLLSEGAEVDTKPSLLIYADDVQCFHGAAAGEADENALFYMMSRGIDRETASNILIRAFADQIVDQVEAESIREHLRRTVTGLLPVFHF